MKQCAFKELTPRERPRISGGVYLRPFNMLSPSERTRSRIRDAWLLFLDHENKMFGAVLALIAVNNGRTLWSRLDEYSIYLMNGIYVTPLLGLIVIAFSGLYSLVASIILLT